MPRISPNQKRKRGLPSQSGSGLDEIASKRRRLRAEPVAPENDNNAEPGEEARPGKRGRPFVDTQNTPAEPAQRQTGGRTVDAGVGRARGKKGVPEANYEADAEIDPPVRRSGRSRKNKAAAPEVEQGEGEAQTAAQSRRSKRGRQQLGVTTTAEASLSQVRKKPTRPRAVPTEVEEEQPPPKRVGRPPKETAVPRQQEDQAKGRGRRPPRVRRGKTQEEPEEESQPMGRGQLTQEHATDKEVEATGPPARRRRGPKKLVSVPEAEAEADPEAESAAPRRRRRKRTPNAEPETHEAQGAASSKRRKNQGPRKSSHPQQQPVAADAGENEAEDEATAEDSESERHEAPPYPHLAPSTRAVPSSLISAKWTALDTPSTALVRTLLTEAAIPVTNRLRSRAKRDVAAQAIDAIKNRLLYKITRGLPFPPAASGSSSKASSKTRRSARKAAPAEGNGGDESKFAPDGRIRENREDDLNFERTVDDVRSLQARLQPLLHSKQLLQRERARLVAQLGREEEHLQQLEKNFRHERAELGRRARQGHVLVPLGKVTSGKPEGEAGGGGENAEATGFVEKEERDVVMGGVELTNHDSKDPMQGKVFQNIDDPELLDLAHQASSHFVSIEGNLAQIADVVPAILDSRATLQGVLRQHLGEAAYGRVMLG